MKRIAAGVIVIAVGIIVAVWRCGSERARTPAGRGEHAGATQSAIASRARADRPLPSWFATRNAPARKIAGRVTAA